MSVQRTAKTIRQDDIISGALFAEGKVVQVPRYSLPINAYERGLTSDVLVVGPCKFDYPQQLKGVFLNAFDESRRNASFLVLKVKPHDDCVWIEAVRLRGDMDCADNRPVHFVLCEDPQHGMTSVELRGIGRTDTTIRQGDIIKSGRLTERAMLEEGKLSEKMTSESRFLVESVRNAGGVFITAVQLSDQDCFNSHGSTRVRFFMSSDDPDVAAYIIRSVQLDCQAYGFQAFTHRRLSLRCR